MKVAYRSMIATDCSHTATSILLILVEVSVKVACQSMTSTDCGHRSITMLLRAMLLRAITMSVHDSHRMKAQSYFHATYLSGSICKSGLLVHDSHRQKAQSYLHATYSDGSICVSGLLVHTVTDCSHSPQATLTEPSLCYLSW